MLFLLYNENRWVVFELFENKKIEMYKKLICFGEIKTQELYKLGVSKREINKLLENGILIRKKIGYYTIGSNKELIDFIISNLVNGVTIEDIFGNLEKSNMIYQEVSERIYKDMLSAISNKSYAEIEYYLDAVLVQKNIDKTKINILFYLFGMSNEEISDKLIQYIKSINCNN